MLGKGVAGVIISLPPETLKRTSTYCTNFPGLTMDGPGDPFHMGLRKKNQGKGLAKPPAAHLPGLRRHERTPHPAGR